MEKGPNFAWPFSFFLLSLLLVVIMVGWLVDVLGDERRFLSTAMAMIRKWR
jgi:hypothetical protein